MTGLVALETFADRYALPVQVGVLQLQILDVPERRPVFWSVSTLIGQQMPEVNVVGATRFPLKLSGEFGHVLLISEKGTGFIWKEMEAALDE